MALMLLRYIVGMVIDHLDEQLLSAFTYFVEVLTGPDATEALLIHGNMV